MSAAITDYLTSLEYDTEEIDLSSFELIEDLDDATWTKLTGFKATMKRVKLPPSILSIRKFGFVECSQLTNVTFPSSLRIIENSAFLYGSGLAMNDLKLPTNLVKLGENAFNSCSGLTGKLTTHITGTQSFTRCKGLTGLDLTNCKVIEQSCFDYCTGLVGKMNLPLSLRRIEFRAFGDCTKLTGALIIPPFVSHIHPSAFEGCSGLINVKQTISEHVVRFHS
jgi:hypothetical protein